MPPKAQSMKEQENELNIHQDVEIPHFEGHLREHEDTAQTGRKSLQSTYLIKNLYPEYLKNSQN